jgi:hypothetical protein
MIVRVGMRASAGDREAGKHCNAMPRGKDERRARIWGAQA